jgi:hypothetical protein
MVEIYGYSIATIPAVCGVVYALVEFIKYAFGEKINRYKKYLPIVACVCGMLVGLLVFFVFPEVMPVTNWYSALIMGGASGLSAVGVNQIKKQMNKQGGEENGS